MAWCIITSASLKICIFMKEIVLSGIRATGQLHLGNYYGALNKFVRMQDDYNCYFFIADLHALTTHPDPTILHANVKSILSEYLAAGIDPDKATIFVQSDVPEIPEMYLLMNMHVGIGELMRTASFKDKARKQLGIKTDNDNDDIEREIIGNNSNKRVNAAEREYILQDSQDDAAADADSGRKLSILECLRLRQTWAILMGKFLTDGVWWFFLFWTPAYISDVYGYTSDSAMAQMLMFTLYAITMLSLYGGKLPTIFINRTGGNAYNCRMKAMFIFALFPLLGLVAQTLGAISCWLTICIIGIVGAAHQSWSANLFSVGSDLFPKKAVATITGINGMAGGLSSFLINFVSGRLLDHVEAAQTVFCGFQGKEAGYFIIFCYCSVAYIAGWLVMKLLVPRYMPVKA